MRRSISRIFFWSLKQLFAAAPLEMCLLFFFVFLQGLIPAASLYAIQGIIQWVSFSVHFPFVWISLWGGLLLIDIVLSPVVAIVRLRLNERVLSFCNLLLMQKANSIQGLDQFENPKLYDEIQFLKNEASKRPLNLVYVLTGFAKEGIALLSVLAVLSTLGWWIPLAMLLANIPHALSTLWFERQSWDQMLFRSPESRKLAWIASLTLDDRVAKEVRLFGFGDFIVRQYKELAQGMQESLSKERWKKSATSVFLSSLTVLSNLAIICAVLMEAKSRTLQIGGLVIVIQALVMTQSQLAGCISYLGMTTPILLFFGKLRTFLTASLCTIAESSSQALPVFNHEINFENISFTYPDGREALSHVSFKIRKGEKIALVGQNGAGKSTLVKLMLRFYDPSEGIITVDGQDLKTLDVQAWRASISGVFQDFGRYHFTIGENIALGDVGASQERLSHAAKKGGFSPVLQRSPNGFDTPLGKEFGGSALSGGEWQKLAMARAFLRESTILILDEPTAALDPESELEIFKRFADTAQGKTALLITHRLGSVKMADRILVFKEGRLIEDGSHHNLLDAQSEYATLFMHQAQQYMQIGNSHTTL